MDVTINRDLLVREFGLARRLGERKSTLPIYSYARVEAEFGGAHITATDGEAALEMLCPAVDVGEAGVMLMPIKTVHEIARASSADTVRLSSDGERLLVQAGGFKSKLGVMPLAEFPNVPDTPKGAVKLSTATIRAAIDKTRFVIEAAAAKTSNPSFNGTLLKLSDKTVEMVATDGRRLAHVRSNGVDAGQGEALVPRKGLDDLATVLAMDDAPESFDYVTEDGKAYFVVDRRRFVTRLLDVDKYPPYKSVMPKAGPIAADVDRDAWLGVLRRVMLVSDLDTTKIRLAFAGKTVTASMESKTVGTATEALPAALVGDGWDTAFDSQYLTEFLAAAGAGTVRLSQATPMSGGLFQSIEGPVEYTYVLMPMAQ